MIVGTTPTGTIGQQVLANVLDSGEPILARQIGVHRDETALLLGAAAALLASPVCPRIMG